MPSPPPPDPSPGPGPARRPGNVTAGPVRAGDLIPDQAPDQATDLASYRSGNRLAELGWDAGWEAARQAAVSGDTSSRAYPAPGPPPQLSPGRVVRADRGRVLVQTLTGPVRAVVVDAVVTTGDWVLLDGGTVWTVLPRRTTLVRGAGRKDTRAQVLGANVDVVLLVVALASAPNLARLDRLLAVGWGSGAQPVVVLTKADLSATASSERDEVADATPGVPVLLTSVVDGRGLGQLRGQLAPGRTVALLGLSGAGKSSLVNALVGTEVMRVGPIREDGKGRHTTAARELVVLPGLGVLLDTPGLRGVQMWDSDGGLERTFADVEALVAECRFGDCQHGTEPGCAVTAAVADGRLSARRFDSYVKLQRELAWLEGRYDARLRAEERRKWKALARSLRHRGHR